MEGAQGKKEMEEGKWKAPEGREGRGEVEGGRE